MLTKILAGLFATLAFGVLDSKADLLLGPPYLTPSTSINFNGGFGSIAQIADGVGLNSDGPPYNGYAPNATSGVITLTLNGIYTLNSFLLANDINVNAEGVQTFQLSFYNANNQLLSTTPTLTAAKGTIPSQTFNLGAVTDVSRVDFNVLSVYTSNPTRIEVREVAFNGTLQVPEPGSVALLALGAAGLVPYLYRRKFCSTAR